MIRYFNRFVPAFLKQYDHQLLVNRPGLWATKWHYMLYAGFIMFLFSQTLIWLQNIHLANIPDSDTTSVIIFVMAAPLAIILLVWFVRVSLFKPWNQGVKNWWIQGLRNQLIYFMGILLVVSVPFAYLNSLHLRMDSLIPYEELIDDVNALHVASGYFTDKHTVFTEPMSSELSIDRLAHDYNRGYHEKGQFVDKNHIFSDEEIRFKLIEAYSPEMRKALIADYIRAWNKYSPEKITASPEQIWQAYVHHEVATEHDLIPGRSWVPEENIDNLLAAHRYGILDFDWEGMMGLIIACFWVWGLALLYLQTNKRLFFLSIGVSVGLLLIQTILTVMVDSMINIRNGEEVAFSMILINWLIFMTYGLWGGVKNKRSQNIKSLSLMLGAALTMVFPPMTFELLDIRSPFGYGAEVETFFVGVIAFIVLWNTLIQPRLMKLQTMPKQT